MQLNRILNIENEAERVNRLYDYFREDRRLSRSKAAAVEFLTTVHYIEQAVKPGSRILDLGAGTGAYSLHLARKGYEVDALELADANIAAFRARLQPKDHVRLVQGNALDLSRYESESFDAVLLFGPLYHLLSREDRLHCIAEAKRVCRQDGLLFLAFISNDMVILTEFSNRPDYFTAGDYDKQTFKLHDTPFVFHTVDSCRALLRDAGLTTLKEIAADGVSELMEDRINALDEEGYAQYLRYHFYICEKPEFLGMSNHLLFVCSI